MRNTLDEALFETLKKLSPEQVQMVLKKARQLLEEQEAEQNG